MGRGRGGLRGETGEAMCAGWAGAATYAGRDRRGQPSARGESGEVLEGVKRHGSEKLDSKARPRVVCGEGVCGTGGARRTRRDVQGGLALQHGRGETGGVT